jgi:hypothetical protein
VVEGDVALAGALEVGLWRSSHFEAMMETLVNMSIVNEGLCLFFSRQDCDGKRRYMVV